MIKRLIKKIITKIRVKKVVDYIIEVGTNHTSSGQYYIYFTDISDEFPWATVNWIAEGMDYILDQIDKRKEILSPTWIGFDENGLSDSFDCNFCGDYCPYWEA